MDTESVQSQPRKRMSPKKWISIIVVIIIILGVGGFFAVHSGLISIGSQEGKTVATVDGTAIHQHDIDIRLAQLKPQYEQAGADLTDPATLKSVQEQIANEIVNEDLVLEDAQKKNITATDAEVQDSINQLVATAGSQDALNQQVKGFGMTQADLNDTVRRNIIIQKYVDQVIPAASTTVSEDEITQAYNAMVASEPASTTPPALSDIHDELEQQLQDQKTASALLDIVNKLKASSTVSILI